MLDFEDKDLVNCVEDGGKMGARCARIPFEYGESYIQIHMSIKPRRTLNTDTPFQCSQSYPTA